MTTMLLLTVAALSGCTMVPKSQYNESQDQLAKSTAALGEARNEVKRLSEHVARQDERILSLLTLGDKRLDKLNAVTSISLGNYTGAIASEGKDATDAVKVYLLPMDSDGAVVKAAGEVKIQLFDLAAPADQNLIGQCEYDVDEVRKHWASGFLTYHYSFVCPWKQGLRPHEDLTVRVEFVDYLTGTHFTTQKVVKVTPLPASSPAGQ